VGVITEKTPLPKVKPVKFILNWGRRYSLWVFNFGLACCSIEFISASAAKNDFIGIEHLTDAELEAILEECETNRPHVARKARADVAKARSAGRKSTKRGIVRAAAGLKKSA